MPLRAVCEAFKNKVTWNETDGSVVIGDSAVPDEKLKAVDGCNFIDANVLAEFIQKKLLVCDKGVIVFSQKNVNIPWELYSTFVSELQKRGGM